MIAFSDPSTFIQKNSALYPNLDPDFICQICFEHPNRFDNIFPNFDPHLHSALRTKKTMRWIYDHVRYDDNEDLDFWFEHFDENHAKPYPKYEIYNYMIEHKNWPFPPVIIEAEFGSLLGASIKLGQPYHLIEGTHRVSYARRMQQLGLLDSSKEMDLIEIRPM